MHLQLSRAFEQLTRAHSRHIFDMFFLSAPAAAASICSAAYVFSNISAQSKCLYCTIFSKGLHTFQIVEQISRETPKVDLNSRLEIFLLFISFLSIGLAAAKKGQFGSSIVDCCVFFFAKIFYLMHFMMLPWVLSRNSCGITFYYIFYTYIKKRLWQSQLRMNSYNE